VQAHIFAKQRGQSVLNAVLCDEEIARYCKLNQEADDTLQMAVERFHLSFRSIKKLQKVARTIADLDASKIIEKKHLLIITVQYPLNILILQYIIFYE